MAYILDIVVILILLFCIWRGWRHGLIRTLVMLVGFVLAAFLAGQISTPVAGGVYRAVLEPRVEQMLVNSVTATGETQVEVGLEDVFGEEHVLNTYFEDLGLPTSFAIGMEDLSEEAVHAALAPVMEQVIEPALIHLLSMVASLLLFVVLLVVVFLLSRLLDAVFKLPLLKQLNQFGGLAAGVLQGVFWTLIFAAVAQFLADCGTLGETLTTEMIEQTWITARLAKWNWLF